jgi:hypothetical protein
MFGVRGLPPSNTQAAFCFLNIHWYPAKDRTAHNGMMDGAFNYAEWENMVEFFSIHHGVVIMLCFYLSLITRRQGRRDEEDRIIRKNPSIMAVRNPVMCQYFIIFTPTKRLCLEIPTR